MQPIETLQQTRRRTLQMVAGISPEEVLWIPPGFRNNVLWNLGHIVVTQQILVYRLAGQPLHVSDEMVARFRAGSAPADWTGTPELDPILKLLEELPHDLATDHQAGRLARYEPYETATGIRIVDLESALAFNGFHEGIHAGTILCIRRLWSLRAPVQAA